jgi:hypothetical protein
MAESTTAFESGMRLQVYPKYIIAYINMFEMAGGGRGGTLAREGGKVKPCEAPWLGLCQGSFPS